MAMFDKRIIEALSKDKRFDGKMVRTLETSAKTIALVRVRNPLHLIALERRFHVVREYPFVRSVGIECGLDVAIALGRMAEVEYVSGESRVHCLGEDSDGQGALTMSKDSGLTGEGVNICIMDTGVNPHSDLSIPKDRIVHFVDLVNGEKFPYDDNGHGTFVAGIAVGNGVLSGRRIRGVAPNANVVGLKVIEKDGESGTFKILDGMQWLFDNFRTYGIRVVCMSFGADPLEFADPLKIGAEMLSRSGLIVVAASGNSGENNLKSPAISDEVISVGAVDNDCNVAEFTSRGIYDGKKRPDVYAKGVNVRGTKAGGAYSFMTGTSASAPYVAGACCLLCEKYRGITPKQAKSVILSTAKRINGNLVFDLT